MHQFNKNRILTLEMQMNSIEKITRVDHQEDLRLSLKPLLNWAKLIGVLPFPDDKPESLISLFYRYLGWLLTILAHSSLLFTSLYWDNCNFWSSKKNSYGYGGTICWSLFINYVNKGMHSICISTSIIFVLSKLWKELLKSLKKTELQLGLQQLDYLNLKKQSWIYLIYCISSEIILVAMIIYDIKGGNSMQPTIARQLMEISCFATKIYPTTAMVLFCIFSLIISQQLKVVEDQVVSLIHPTYTQNAENMTRTTLTKLQSQHIQIYLSTDLLNRCFGLILLIDIPFQFIGIINTTMSFFMNGSHANWFYCLLQWVLIMNHIVNMVWISFRAQNIASYNRHLGKTLYQLLDCQPKFKPEIQSFTTQLIQLSPGVCACGFFKVGKELIPTLIGTTLTYILIMVQFYASEV